MIGNSTHKCLFYHAQHPTFRLIARIAPQNTLITLLLAGVHHPLKSIPTPIVNFIEVAQVVIFHRIVDWLVDGSYGEILFGYCFHQVGENNAQDGRQYLTDVSAFLFGLEAEIF